MAGELAAARLDYASQGQLSDNVDSAVLAPEALKHMAEIPDQIMRETLRDYYLNTQFRRDIYTRGAPTCPPAAQTSALREQRWVLASPRSDVTLKIKTAGGEITLDEKSFQPVLDRLALGDASTDELFALPGMANVGLNRLLQGLILLASIGNIHPVTPALARKPDGATALRFNELLTSAPPEGSAIFVVSPLTGQSVARNDVSVTQSRLYTAGHQEPNALALAFAEDLKQRGHRVQKNGKPVESDGAQSVILQGIAEKFISQEIPMLKNLQLM